MPTSALTPTMSAEREAQPSSAERETEASGVEQPGRVRRSSKVTFKPAWIEETLEPPEPPTAAVDSSRVLHEQRVLKRSRWLGQWRWRWLVVTPARVRSYAVERGHESGSTPTESYDVSRELVGARILNDGEVSSASSTPLSCISFAAPPALQPAAEHVIVQVRLSAGRALLVACDGTRAAAALTTAVVNVLSAARSGQTHYLSAGLHHAFEPRGLVAEPLRSRYLVAAEIGRGAYGTVFRGTCLQSGRAVAIKRLSLRPPKGWNGRGENPVRGLVRAEVAILRELREARHIVRLLDYVEDARSSALVMELLQP